MDYWRLTFDLYIDVEKLWVVGGGWVVYLDYNVSSGPFLSYEIEIGDGPGPELDNWSHTFVKDGLCAASLVIFLQVNFCICGILSLLTTQWKSFLSLRPPSSASAKTISSE